MTKKSKGTGKNPIIMSRELSQIVNNALNNGTFCENVTPITQDLLKFWFKSSFCDNRNFNFHEGQKQAILNIIYAHEILKVKNVKDLYLSINPDILNNIDSEDLNNDKYQHPMYAVKMATGTGKTWVMHALLIWQYLNAVEYDDDRFSKNFLFVTPGIIVYNRLLDAFLGKENKDGRRDFETSDFMQFKELFIPKVYENKIFGFLQSSVVKREEISTKVTGDGLIAITNWQSLLTEEKDEEFTSPLENPEIVLNNALPIFPTKKGKDLNELDKRFFKGKEIEYLSNLNNIVVINDEAHHIHTYKKNGDIFEVEWQKSLNEISKFKGGRFIQIDFSATPYTTTGGKNKIKHYFPHIIVDFDLKTAVNAGLVKMITIDRRDESSSVELDFNAIKDDAGNVIGLSSGQKLMLKAGLKKLKILDEKFREYDESKRPKMLVICEDTKVAPLVSEFFINEGLNDEEILEIHSKKRNKVYSVDENEWNSIKQRLFNMDKYENPKIIISVLMLREGFDVNNICVIVPLRSSESDILLEQIVGRGLRLMWRENIYKELKAEASKQLFVEKREPFCRFDILSIIEHPKFINFYNEFINEGYVAEIGEEINSKDVLGDMINVGLRKDYKKYDMYWPNITKESEEILNNDNISINELKPYNISLSDLYLTKGENGEKFISQELTSNINFGEYVVIEDLFTAESYNEFLIKLIKKITFRPQKIGKKIRNVPAIQINQSILMKLIDEYIRTKLFNEDFNPFIDENWKILLSSDGSIVNHIVEQLNNVIYYKRKNIDVTDAEVNSEYFSQVKELKMRENYSVPITKSIYERLPYSSKSKLEKRFLEALDNDGQVSSFIKIYEYYHTFATISYIREDGLLARYYPDFIVKIDNDVYVVETKAKKDKRSQNVIRKGLATLDTLRRINKLKGQERMDAKWNYVLLTDNTFYSMYDKGASIKTILDYAIMTEAKVKGTLDDLF